MHSVMEQHSQLLVPDELEAPTCRKVTLKLNILKINRFFAVRNSFTVARAKWTDCSLHASRAVALSFASLAGSAATALWFDATP